MIAPFLQVNGEFMPTVLAFGDSNTWGSIPGQDARMAPDVRWPGVMARALGTSFKVIEEGLRGRTTVFDDPEELGRNGLVYFAPCLLRPNSRPRRR